MISKMIQSMMSILRSPKRLHPPVAQEYIHIGQKVYDPFIRTSPFDKKNEI